MDREGWEKDMEGSRRLALLSQTPNFSFARMYTVELEGGENFAGGEETRKKSQAGSPRQGARSFRTFIYKGTGWTSAGKQPQTITYKDERRQRGSHWPGTEGERTSALTHVLSHTCIHMCAHAHGCTATHALRTQCSHVYALTHAPACTHTHSLIHTVSNLEKLTPILEVQSPQSYKSP